MDLQAYGKQNGPPEGGPFRTMSRQRPTLPPSHPGSTIGAGGLNFRVRDGTGCSPSAMATETRCPIVTFPRRISFAEFLEDDRTIVRVLALEQNSRTAIASASIRVKSSGY